MCSFWCARFCVRRPYSFFTDDILSLPIGIGRLLVTTSKFSLWSKFAAEEFANSPKAEALCIDFVHGFGSKLVLDHVNGEEIEVQVHRTLVAAAELHALLCMSGFRLFFPSGYGKAWQFIHDV